jgi:RND family efflux transporter MFP subunit
MTGLVRRAALIGAIAVAVGCGGGEEEETPAPVVSARLTAARVQPFELTIAALGVVTPRAGRFAELAPLAEARVSRIYVATGDRVQAGDPLIEFESTVWEAEAERARSAVDAARSESERAAHLADSGIVPRKQAEQAEAALAAAEADLAAARRTLALAVLRSPIAGIVSRMSARLDASVDPTTPLVEIVDPEALEVVFHLSPGDAARVEPGARVLLEADSSAMGRVAGIDAAIDSTGSVEVRARMAGGSAPLWLGQSVAGSIVEEVHPDAVVVPASAVVPAGGDSLVVFVVGADSTAHARPVVVGGRSASQVEIASGLEGGELVVAGGAYGMVDGARVREGGP